MVAHTTADIVERHLAIGDDIEGHGLLVHVTLYELGVLIHPLVEGAEEAPHTSFAGSEATEVVGVISLLEVEVLVALARVPAVLTSELDDILLIHTVLLVTEGDLVDTSLIGVCADRIVGDADSYPYGTLLVGALADHL